MLYLNDVYRYAFARLGQREDAEDVAIEVVQALPCPCHRRDLKLYMLGVARRKVVDRLRRKRNETPVSDIDATTRFDAASDEAAMVGVALGRISESHRDALVLKYVAGLTSAEVGKTLGRKPEAVDSLLQRARDAFAQEWLLLTDDEVTK